MEIDSKKRKAKTARLDTIIYCIKFKIGLLKNDRFGSMYITKGFKAVNSYSFENSSLFLPISHIWIRLGIVIKIRTG